MSHRISNWKPVRFPVTVLAGDLRPLVEPAIARWNDCAGLEVFRYIGGNSLLSNVVQALVRPTDGPTYTDMDRLIVYWNEPPEREYWMAHELGHLLGLGDHLWANFPGREKYRDPVIETWWPDDAARAEMYHGVMSYLTHPDDWFGEDDREMIYRLLFPWRATTAAVAKDGEA